MADINTGGLRLFGFEIKRASKNSTSQTSKTLPSVVPPTDFDGAGYVTAAAGHYGQYVNLDGENTKDNHQLIMLYRGVAMHPEIDMAIEEIVNEAIIAADLKSSVEISLDDVEAPERIKKQIREEFNNIVAMLRFNEIGHEIFRSWYIDGRIYHHLLVNESNTKAGIQEIRYIDSAKIRKIKEVKYKKDATSSVKIVDSVDEYYIFEEKIGGPTQTSIQTSAVRLSNDSISYVSSGLLDETKKKVISYLHKALKPVNQLRMMEDSLVIYRLARAPERRIFYIDVGNLPKGKAEEYMTNIMAKYRNKLVYDVNTGQIKDDRKHMAMLEDFWLPRRENGRGTEITTLPGGDNLGQIDDIVYFQKRLYRSLNVPVNRLEQEAQFSLGRSTEISRDEVKFQKFIDRLRRRFSWVFLGILKKQLILKGVCTEQDWDEWKDSIFVDFVKDNYFTELTELDIFKERVGVLTDISQFVGDYFSKEWIMRQILKFSDEEIEQMRDEIDEEKASGEIVDEQEQQNAGAPGGAAPGAGGAAPATAPAQEQPAFSQDSIKSDTFREKYVPTHEDELMESMARFVNKLADKED